MKTNKDQVFILGTRPTVIKLAPLIKKINPFVIHTGQHSELAQDMLDLFEITPDINLELMTHDQSLTDFAIKCLDELNKIIEPSKFRRVWVHGDTVSCLAGGLIASMKRIQLVHNEAGLRSFDKNNPFPEETNRILLDKMSDVLFAPTSQNVINLKKENTQGRVYQVGNTIVDALEMIKLRLPKERPVKEKYVLMTMHRRESFDKDIHTVFKVVKELTKEIKVIFPAHPNPNVQEAIKKSGITAVSALNYSDFLWYLRDCEFVMSDSGGLQEECPSFNKPILILRKKTERQEILDTGMAVLTDLTEKDLMCKIHSIKQLVGKKYQSNPFGSGDSSDRIIKILNEKEF